MSNYEAQPTARVAGAIRVPGDKSISHRALMLGGIASGITEVRGFLTSEDCLATMNAMRTLGVKVEQTGAQEMRVHGAGLRGLHAANQVLDMGNSGTAMRLMTGLLCGQSFDSELVGDGSLMKRPMERVATPLRQMGARIQTNGGKPPVRIFGGAHLSAIKYELPVASAQVKSALMLAGLYSTGSTVVVEPAVTRDHTERMLLSFGCHVEVSHGKVALDPPVRLEACSIEVPGDFSSAAFFLVAGSIGAGASLTIEGIGVNPTRTGLLDILALMGADLRVVNHRSAGAEPVADIEVRGTRLKGIHVPEHLVPLAIDEFPVLFIAAACAEGTTVVTGAEELRVKESDRIAVMAEGLRAVGVACDIRPDGLSIEGRPDGPVFSAGTVDSHGDHRIAMSFAVASARASGPIKIRDVANVATSFPNFVGVARAAGLDLREA
jgi:3-phosphoshikimate 1-carboxyvinyltransferase